VGLAHDPYYGVRRASRGEERCPSIAGLREAEEVMRALDAAYASARVGRAVQTLN
jgi:hypothetical protein